MNLNLFYIYRRFRWLQSSTQHQKCPGRSGCTYIFKYSPACTKWSKHQIINNCRKCYMLFKHCGIIFTINWSFMQLATIMYSHMVGFTKRACDCLPWGQGPSGDQLTLKDFTENSTWPVVVIAVCLEWKWNVPFPSNSGFCNEEQLQRPGIWVRKRLCVLLCCFFFFFCFCVLIKWSQ